MNQNRNRLEDSCRIEAATFSKYRELLPEKVDRIIDTCRDGECYTHIDFEPIASRVSVIEIIEKGREFMFPGYFSGEKIDPVNLKYTMGQCVSMFFEMLSEQIINSIRHDCFRYERPCSDCIERGQRISLEFLDAVPEIRKTLSQDVKATYEGDPAAKSHDEVIISYPGIYAIMVYRMAHKLFQLGVPLLPRIMTEHAHSKTGIDIHPGAVIGERFVIDHGTGVVIGETTSIGNNVRLYQGVTLGALSVPKEEADRLRFEKRHPTIEDDVVIYSGATILGGKTVIGARSVIGGNVWITEPIPPDTTVMIKKPRLVYK
jgi:serine O-acetyltransferase